MRLGQETTERREPCPAPSLLHIHARNDHGCIALQQSDHGGNGNMLSLKTHAIVQNVSFCLIIRCDLISALHAACPRSQFSQALPVRPRADAAQHHSGYQRFRLCAYRRPNLLFIKSAMVQSCPHLRNTHFCFFSAGLRIWKEQSRLSSTLIIAPALSNSPQ